MHKLQRRFSLIAVDVRSWLSNYTPFFYMDVITYPFPNLDAGLANLC